MGAKTWIRKVRILSPQYKYHAIASTSVSLRHCCITIRAFLDSQKSAVLLLTALLRAFHTKAYMTPCGRGRMHSRRRYCGPCSTLDLGRTSTYREDRAEGAKYGEMHRAVAMPEGQSCKLHQVPRTAFGKALSRPKTSAVTDIEAAILGNQPA